MPQAELDVKQDLCHAEGMRLARLPQQTCTLLANRLKSQGYRRVQALTGLAPATLKRAVSGLPVALKTHTQVEKLARTPQKTRQASEFVQAAQRLKSLPKANGARAWTLELIRGARNAQQAGSFATAVMLAEATRTDDAIFTARSNRIAPQYALTTELKPHDTARGKDVAKRASESVTVTKATLAGIHGTLADHGVAIGYVQHDVDADGTRVDMRLTEWPLEHVIYDTVRDVLTTKVKDSFEPADIVHGDGRWVVFRKFDSKPWTQEACLLPAALLWAAHTDALSDWAGATRAHGLARVMGELPEGFSLKDEDGNLTEEASAFLEMIADVVSGEQAAGLVPPGAKTNFLTNQSTAWQVFSELVSNREKSAARIYLGTDAILGSVGGAPGVDIAALFGVATTKLQGDLTAIQDALYTGLYVPWTAINYGDSRLAPRLVYLLPDPDEDAKREQASNRRQRLHTLLQQMREQKLTIDQNTVNKLAAELGIDDPPLLASVETQTSTLVLEPTDVARVTRVWEARASQGLPPFGNDDDNLTISQFEAKQKAQADAAARKAEIDAQANADVRVKAAPEAAAPPVQQ